MELQALYPNHESESASLMEYRTGLHNSPLFTEDGTRAMERRIHGLQVTPHCSSTHPWPCPLTLTLSPHPVLQVTSYRSPTLLDYVRQRLPAFYSIFCPGKMANTERILRSFILRGGDLKALDDLNDELREAYGQDLNFLSGSMGQTPTASAQRPGGGHGGAEGRAANPHSDVSLTHGRPPPSHSPVAQHGGHRDPAAAGARPNGAIDQSGQQGNGGWPPRAPVDGTPTVTTPLPDSDSPADTVPWQYATVVDPRAPAAAPPARGSPPTTS